MQDDLLHRDDVCRIVGTWLTVHKGKGNGLVEPVYQDSLQTELEYCGIPFDAQRNNPINYQGRSLLATIGARTAYPHSFLNLASLRELRDFPYT